MHYNDVPSLVDYETRELCIDLGVQKLQDGDIAVELGSYCGGSIFRLAKQLKDLNKAISVYAIDNWECKGVSIESLAMANLAKHSDVYNTFLSYLHQLDLHEYIYPIKENTVEAAKLFNDKSVNYIFFDANHGYVGVKDELTAWIPKMADRCLAFVHDWPAGGIQQAVYEVWGKDIEVVKGGSTAILRNTL